LLVAHYNFYIDALQPASLLSLSLQDRKLDIVLGIKQLVKTVKSLKKLGKGHQLGQPTSFIIIFYVIGSKMRYGKKLYQGAVFKN